MNSIIFNIAQGGSEILTKHFASSRYLYVRLLTPLLASALQPRCKLNTAEMQRTGGTNGDADVRLVGNFRAFSLGLWSNTRCHRV